MRDGLFPIVGVAGAVSAALVWTMSVNDPYWRLFETPSIPAPAYEATEDLRAALETATMSFGNADTGAASPVAEPVVALSDTDPLADIERISFSIEMTPRETQSVTIPAPMTVLARRFEPAPMAGPTAGMMASYRLPRFAQPALESQGAGSEPVLAVAPVPLPAPVAVRDQGILADAITADRLDGFVAPDAPAQPHVPADETSEEALALDRDQRIDIQRRLALAGFDPKGFDGVFGPRTRAAISDFQTAWGFPASGYLEAAVYADLNQRTEEAYQSLRRQAAAAPSAAPALAPVARERQVASAEEEGRCARRSDGQIIARQSLGCDLVGLTEKFVSLGRNSLDFESEEEEAVATPMARLATPGAER